MKALTIKQPFATLIMNGTKVYEMRNWQPKELGLLAIHAAAKPMSVVEMMNSGVLSYADNLWQPLGYVLGVVKVEWCRYQWDMVRGDGLAGWNDELNPWDFNGKDCCAWKLSVVEVFEQPIRAKGQLGLWEWAHDGKLVTA